MALRNLSGSEPSTRTAAPCANTKLRVDASNMAVKRCRRVMLGPRAFRRSLWRRRSDGDAAAVDSNAHVARAGDRDRGHRSRRCNRWLVDFDLRHEVAGDCPHPPGDAHRGTRHRNLTRCSLRLACLRSCLCRQSLPPVVVLGCNVASAFRARAAPGASARTPPAVKASPLSWAIESLSSLKPSRSMNRKPNSGAAGTGNGSVGICAASRFGRSVRGCPAQARHRVAQKARPFFFQHR